VPIVAEVLQNCLTLLRSAFALRIQVECVCCTRTSVLAGARRRESSSNNHAPTVVAPEDIFREEHCKRRQ